MIYLRNSTRRHALDAARLKRTARALLAAAGRGRTTLSLSLVGDAAIRRLNREYRGKDRATDVLSFPLLDPSRAARAQGSANAPEALLGDVVISLDAAERQAATYGATLEREVLRLLIHGVLHLLGYDHEGAAERRRMVARERRLAATIGLPWPYAREGQRRE